MILKRLSLIQPAVNFRLYDFCLWAFKLFCRYFTFSKPCIFLSFTFLGAGSVIHSVSDEQDIRKMGGLKPLIQFTYSMMVVGSLAKNLVGFPFLVVFKGFEILEAA